MTEGVKALRKGKRTALYLQTEKENGFFQSNPPRPKELIYKIAACILKFEIQISASHSVQFLQLQVHRSRFF